MSREQFEALVASLESVASQRPKAYVVRVAALALFGYAYIFGVLLLMVALTVGLFAMVVAVPNGLTIKLGFVFGAITVGLSWAILKALWVRLEHPEGIELTRAEVPELFKALDDLRQRLRAPRFHKVLLDGAYNAAVIQVPRLGLLGWHTNYLIIGLPLLHGLSPDEFRGVLAHEFGHLSGNHARFGAWTYRVRRTWERVVEEMFKQGQAGAGILLRFLRWFWPKFNAHTFVLSRANEYVADRCSAEIVGAPTAATALVRVCVHAPYLDESVWPSIYKAANEHPEPPSNPFASVAAAFHRGVPASEAARWLRTAFFQQTNTADTHPCLKDRLVGLGSPLAHTDPRAASLEVVQQTAADVYLGGATESLALRLSQLWGQRVKEAWQQRHQQASELRKKLAEHAAAATPEDLWKKAELLLDLEGDEAARPVIDEILALAPAHAGANFVRGRHALGKDLEEGVAFLERAMAEDPACIEEACGLLYGFYTRSGQLEKLKPLEKRLDDFHQSMELAQAERRNIRAEDKFAPHELTPEMLRHLQEIFASEPDIHEVRVARKLVRLFPKYPVHVFSVQLKVPWYKPRSSDAGNKLIQRVVQRIQIPGDCFLFVPKDAYKALGSSIKAVPDSTIYQRAS